MEQIRTSATNWFSTQTNFPVFIGDRLRTGERSRASLRLTDRTVLRIAELTVIEFEAPVGGESKPVVKQRSGSSYFYGRDKPTEHRISTPLVSAAIRGTEFNLDVSSDGRTVLTLLEGEVDMENTQGRLNLKNREQAVVEPGQPPVKTALIDAVSIIQWALYYPGVLHIPDLELSEHAHRELTDSLKAYQSGDLLAALGKWPPGRVPISDSEQIYRAALLLSVGQVKECELLLKDVGNVKTPEGQAAHLANALQRLLTSVTGQKLLRSDLFALPSTPLATEWMAESYYQQARLDLSSALLAARNAVARAPDFGFGWVRVAELEFSFGRTAAAGEALRKGLQLSPRNAQGLALRGFLLAAQNRTAEAVEAFDQAIGVDSALGNAWLGRGLCKIRRGELEAGRLDLQTACAMEPQRAVFRSYLGKAFSQVRDATNARLELDRAAGLDPSDPTSSLYSALLNQQENRINEAVHDLEKSTELNGNRRVFRSRLLLDQDQSVRGANLAGIYHDAGMFDVSAREAARAVNADYANYSAHLFLANSLNALRDPRQINLRYETPWLSEFLLANLLAPVGSGTLSQQVSQQEYSRLLERDRIGLSSSTEYLSSGSWVQAGSQFGTFGKSAYALDTLYRTDSGQRPNEDLEQLTVSAKFKQQLSPADSVYFQAIYYDFESGDIAQYYDPSSSHPRLRAKESQEPILLGGYHHQWSPGSHSLLLIGRMLDEYEVTDPDQSALILSKSDTGQLRGVSVLPTRLSYRSELEFYTAELQQIWQREKHSVVLGARYQNGGLDSQSQFERAPFSTDLERVSFYGYHHWRLLDPLLLTAGVSYDHLAFPLNFRNPPLSDQGQSKERISPKTGLIWTPWPNTSVRGSYTRSLGGVSFDQSFRLEPVQIAGFHQAYRSLISESVIGAVASPTFETWGAALDQKFATGTYAGIAAELLKSNADRTIGALDSIGFPPQLSASSTVQALDYEERAFSATLNQLVGRHWAFGVRYEWSESGLDAHFTEIPATFGGGARTEQNAQLHRVNLIASFNHENGFFGAFEPIWLCQENRGYSPELPGDDFWQLNLHAGYRFRQRAAEIRLGLLNLADRDYRLNPLNPHNELPRERTFAASFRFNF